MFKEYFNVSLWDTFRSWTLMETLVGTLGLVVVLARNVIQRRAELALLLALGFTRHRITLMLVIVVGACLSGAAGAIRELIKERAIYQRERSVGLSSAAYLASKIAVTTTIGAGRTGGASGTGQRHPLARVPRLADLERLRW